MFDGFLIKCSNEKNQGELIMSGHVVKVVLENTKPPIWRRIVIPENIRFDDLHEIIQIAFNWDEMHPHEFSFPYGPFRIVSSEPGRLPFSAFETNVIYEDYCDKVNWIRYTYSLDEMINQRINHKIIYERLDESYNYRYATVLKAKGNSHGDLEYGFLGEEEASEDEEFSMEHTNAMLENFVIPRRKSKLAKAKLARDRELEEEILKLSEEITKYKKENEQIRESAWDRSIQISEVTKKNSISKRILAIEEWEAFADLKLEDINSASQFISGHLTHTVESHEISPNQTTLFGVDNTEDRVTQKNIKVIFPREKIEVSLNKPSKSMRQYLSELNAKEVRIHSKYLHLNTPRNATKNDGLDSLEALFKKQPEYILWIFNEEEWRALAQLFTLEAGEALPYIDIYSVSKAMSIGLLDCKISNRNSNYRVTFTFAREMKEIVKTFNQRRLENLFHQLETLDENLRPIILVYGMMDLESLYALYNKYNTQKITYTEFKRLIYWRGIFNGHLRAFDNLLDGKSYAAAIQIDYDLAISMREEYMEGKPYKAHDKKSLMELARGFDLFYESWHQYSQYLLLGLGFDEEAISHWLPEAYVQVINGASSTDLIHSTLEFREPKNIFEYRELWYTVFHTVMETGLVGLKGYSRIDYINMERMLPKLLPAVTNRRDVVRIGRTTHIYEMSQYIQLEVFNYGLLEIPEAIKGMSSLINKYGNANEELKFILAEMHEMNGNFKEAKKILLEIKLGSKKEDYMVEKLISLMNERIKTDCYQTYPEENLKNYTNNVVPFPIKKNTNTNAKVKEVKIGRNDPCPCGSGKKYKNCCRK